jgi:hypothetical protein
MTDATNYFDVPMTERLAILEKVGSTDIQELVQRIRELEDLCKFHIEEAKKQDDLLVKRIRELEAQLSEGYDDEECHILHLEQRISELERDKILLEKDKILLKAYLAEWCDYYTDGLSMVAAQDLYIETLEALD